MRNGRLRGLAALALVAVFFHGGSPSAFRAAAVTAQESQADVQEGDLFVGTAIVTSSFGDTKGRIQRVRNGSVETFCESPSSGLDPNFFNVPHDVIVDSRRRVVFLAYMGPFFFSFQDYGLFRCERMGEPAELLAVFPSRATAVHESYPLPFPGLSFDRVSGLHLARVPRVTIDDDTNGGVPEVSIEDAYAFAAMVRDPGDPRELGELLEVKSVRYLPSRDTWEAGPGPIAYENDLLQPDLWNAAGDTFVAIPSRAGRQDIIRRIRAPLRVEASGRAGDVDFIARLDLFGGFQDIGGGSSQGAFADIAATSFVLDDRSVPNPSVCPSDGSPITTAVPYTTGGTYQVLAGIGQVVVDQTFGLVVTSNSGASGYPYLGNIDRTLLNDNPSDDLSAWFFRPELGCIPQRSIKHTPILPFFDPDGSGPNGATNLAATEFGLFGTQPFQGRVIRVIAGSAAQVVVNGLSSPTGIGGYPAYVPGPSNLSVVIRVNSPVDVLVTDSEGRRIGVDPATGQPVNDYGELGFDSGPGEPRFYAIRDAVPGTFQVESAGTGEGPFAIDLYSINLASLEGRRARVTGTAWPGSMGDHDFILAENGAGLSFVAPPPQPIACDVDGDADVDRLDVGLIMSTLNTPASGPADPRDRDGDGRITVLDARACTLVCTRPVCAIQ